MHPLVDPGRLAKIRELAKRGVGLAFLHYSIDPPAGGQPDLMAWMGGCYEAGYSQNPVNVVKVTPASSGHPIARGCSGYVVEDEWYFDIRFRAERCECRADPDRQAATRAAGQGPRLGLYAARTAAGASDSPAVTTRATGRWSRSASWS